MSSTTGTKTLSSRQQHQPYQPQLHQQLYQNALIRRPSLALEVKKEIGLGQVVPKPVVGGYDEKRVDVRKRLTNPDKLSTADREKQVFEEAVRIYNETLAKDVKQLLDPKKVTTMADVLEYTEEAMKSWENKPRWRTPRRWLERLSGLVTHYGKIMDVLVQHHAEYASLAWGAMKLLFVLVINHQTAVKEIAKTLTKISDSLSRVAVLSILYPSDEMIKAAATLYAHMLSFLQRAIIWYKSDGISHCISAFFKPFEVSFGDLVDDIRVHGERVINLADVEHKLETREIKDLLHSENVGQPGIGVGAGQELDTRKGMQGQAHYPRVTPDTFFSIYELQNTFLPSPHHQKKLCRAMFGKLRPCLGYKSPGFENLKISGVLGLPIELDFRGLPKALGRLAVELKDTATKLRHQIAFIFCSNETVRRYLKSPVDIVKLLVFHVLEHNPNLLLERQNALPMDRLQAAQTITDFLEILEEILRSIPSILFIIDSYALSTAPGEKSEDVSRDIRQLNEGLSKLSGTFENSVKILFTTRLPGKLSSPTDPLFEKRRNTLRLDGGMVGWMEGDGESDDFPLPSFRGHAFITQAAVVPSDDEAFLKMITPEGGYISAGTPNGFSLPKRPSWPAWPSNPYSIVRHKCVFREHYDRNTVERTLTTAKFPHISTAR